MSTEHQDGASRWDKLWDLNVSDVRFVAFDTETTGVSNTDHLVELAAIAFDEEFDHRRFETLVRPPVPIPAAATSIHGITDAMVAAAPGAAEASARFLDFLGWVGGPRVLVAHNAGFDVGFLHRVPTSALKRAGAVVAADVSTADLVLDSCMLSRVLLPDLDRQDLGTVARHLKAELGTRHRAMGDVETLRRVFLGLLGLAADRAAAVGSGLTLGALVDLAGGFYVLDPMSRNGDGGRTRSFRLPSRIAALEALCGSDAQVAIAYESEEDWRYVTPVAFKRRGERIYLEAHCHRDGVKKTFRADRIVRVRATP